MMAGFPQSFVMKKASFCLLALLLICAVFAEWDPVECTNKDVLKAIDVDDFGGV